MEPYILIAIAAVALVVFYLVWNSRSRQNETGTQRETRADDRDRPPS
jgi:hypothetical protein